MHQKIQRPVDGGRLGIVLVLRLELVQQLVGTLRARLGQQQRHDLTPLGSHAHALLAATDSALGLAVGAAAPRAEQALAVGAPIMVIHMLVGVIDPAGAENEKQTRLMRILRALSPVRHGINALCLAELKDVTFAPSSTGGVVDALKNGPSMGALAGVRSGNDVLERLGTPRTYRQPMTHLCAVCAMHLAAGLAALVLTAPRFAASHTPGVTDSGRAS